MESKAIQLMKSHFDALSQTTPEEGVEFWFARDLMEPLGYARWENFQTAIKRAIESCETTGYAADDHFRGVTKMIEIGKGGHLFATQWDQPRHCRQRLKSSSANYTEVAFST